jgi:hypothetical protein
MSFATKQVFLTHSVFCVLHIAFDVFQLASELFEHIECLLDSLLVRVDSLFQPVFGEIFRYRTFVSILGLLYQSVRALWPRYSLSRGSNSERIKYFLIRLRT